MIPRLTEGGTVVCLAPGPSLTREDVEAVRDLGVVIAINDAVRLAPWAAVLYSSDASWWSNYRGTFEGPRYKVSASMFRLERQRWPNVVTLKNTGERGVDFTPDCLRTGHNSGSAAINLAVHLGAGRIVLLGYDMGPVQGRHHFFETKPVQHRSPYEMFRKYLATMVDPLTTAGIEVVNCSRSTRLECFPCRPLAEVLDRDRAVFANV